MGSWLSSQSLHGARRARLADGSSCLLVFVRVCSFWNESQARAANFSRRLSSSVLCVRELLANAPADCRDVSQKPSCFNVMSTICRRNVESFPGQQFMANEPRSKNLAVKIVVAIKRSTSSKNNVLHPKNQLYTTRLHLLLIPINNTWSDNQ